MIIIQPAALKTKEAAEYVGGRPVWEELLEKYPKLLRPLRTTERGDAVYLVRTIDAVLITAESERSLIHKPDPAKQGKRKVRTKGGTLTELPADSEPKD